jgi:hypothetical protein
LYSREKKQVQSFFTKKDVVIITIMDNDSRNRSTAKAEANAADIVTTATGIVPNKTTSITLINDLASSRVDGLSVEKRNDMIRVVTDCLSENPTDRSALADHGGE